MQRWNISSIAVMEPLKESRLPFGQQKQFIFRVVMTGLNGSVVCRETLMENQLNILVVDNL